MRIAFHRNLLDSEYMWAPNGIEDDSLDASGTTYGGDPTHEPDTSSPPSLSSKPYVPPTPITDGDNPFKNAGLEAPLG